MSRNTIAVVVLAVAVVLALVPAAPAATRPDDRTGIRSAAGTEAPVRPDDRTGARGPGLTAHRAEANTFRTAAVGGAALLLLVAAAGATLVVRRGRAGALAPDVG